MKPAHLLHHTIASPTIIASGLQAVPARETTFPCFRLRTSCHRLNIIETSLWIEDSTGLAWIVSLLCEPRQWATNMTSQRKLKQKLKCSTICLIISCSCMVFPTHIEQVPVPLVSGLVQRQPSHANFVLSQFHGFFLGVLAHPTTVSWATLAVLVCWAHFSNMVALSFAKCHLQFDHSALAVVCLCLRLATLAGSGGESSLCRSASAHASGRCV